MSATIFDMEDARRIEDNVVFKAISGQIGIDKAEGIVECFVSGIGNKDSVGDIVMSGAFNGSLKRRKPRVVWGHDWNQPIGKVLEIYEVPASDPRLPNKMKQAGIGGLFAKVQFNLNTERGREAFANVAFYGNEQEWSIGYKTLTADFDTNNQANVLKEVELYEISPVLHGANQLTGTISVKDEKGGMNKPSMEMGSMSAMLSRAISQALRKPVEIISSDEGMVVFQSGPNMMWRAPFNMTEGSVQIGKPVRVRANYVPVEEDEAKPPANMMRKENVQEPEGIRDAEPDEGTWATPDIALAWAKTFGCEGYHSEGAGYLPCETPEEYRKALAAFDDNANLNSHNNYLGGVEVEEAKDGYKGHMGGSCPSCGMGMRKKPDYLKDPLALLMMAYNEMIPLRGAGELRDSTLELIEGVGRYLADSPASLELEKGAKSGFILHVKCDELQSLDVTQSVAHIPVFSFKSDSGVDIHFSTKMDHQELLEKVATSLSTLDFDPDLSVTKPKDVDTNSGVE